MLWKTKQEVYDISILKHGQESKKKVHSSRPLLFHHKSPCNQDLHTPGPVSSNNSKAPNKKKGS